MPAIRRSDCMILGTGHPPFVFTSKRPVNDIRCIEWPAAKQSLGRDVVQGVLGRAGS